MPQPDGGNRGGNLGTRLAKLHLLALVAAGLMAACNLQRAPSLPPRPPETDWTVTRQALGPIGESLEVRVNHDRDVLGLPALIPSQALADAAGLRAEDMTARGYLGAVGPGDVSVAAQDLMSVAGYSGQLGELIYEHDGPLPTLTESALGAWMASDAHRRLLLDTRFKYVGVGLLGESDRWIIVLLFAEVGP